MLDEPDDSIVSSTKVENLSSPLLDHTTYWRNREQFVSVVANHVAQLSDIQVDRLRPWDAELLDRARKRRSWRIKWLRVGRILTLFAVALPVFSCRELLFSANSPVARVLNTWFIE